MEGLGARLVHTCHELQCTEYLPILGVFSVQWRWLLGLRCVRVALEVAVSTVLAVCIMIYTCTMEGEKSHDHMTACRRDPGPMTTQHNPTIDTIVSMALRPKTIDIIISTLKLTVTDQ